MYYNTMKGGEKGRIWSMIVIVFFLFKPANCFGFHAAAFLATNAPPKVLWGKSDENDEPDLFEYFDPLLSPHAYPNGISPDNKPVDTQQSQTAQEISPIVKKAFGFDLTGGPTKSMVSSSAPVNTDKVFDPRVSPHEYPNGTPEKIFGFPNETSRSTTKVGILLMDHGSRNPASNERLQNLARLYQESLQDPNIVVRAAHMEIASPSVPQGLECLLAEGVDEIICHPYFLSPGRHVQEDIPAIVQAAIESLQIEIPVVTTEPLGSQTDIMIGAIHSAVKQTEILG